MAPLHPSRARRDLRDRVPRVSVGGAFAAPGCARGWSATGGRRARGPKAKRGRQGDARTLEDLSLHRGAATSCGTQCTGERCWCPAAASERAGGGRRGVEETGRLSFQGSRTRRLARPRFIQSGLGLWLRSRPNPSDWGAGGPGEMRNGRGGTGRQGVSSGRGGAAQPGRLVSDCRVGVVGR